MKVIEIEKDIFRPIGGLLTFAFKLTDKYDKDIPLVELINKEGKPMNIFRYISFDPQDIYMAEVY